MSSPEDEAVHPLVRKGTAWAWRLLVLLAAALAMLWVLSHFAVILVPLAIAVILTALLRPGVDWLVRKRVPRGGAVVVMLVSGLAVFGGILAFVITRLIDGLPELFNQVTISINSLRNWLIDGPLGLEKQQIDSFGNSVIDALRNQQARLTSGVLSTAGTITEVIAGLFIVAFALVSFLHGGRNIFQFVTQIFPLSVRERVRSAGKAGFGALVGYVRAAFLVALIDAVGIGAGLLIMGVPLALPLASLVFVGAFIPFIGAVVTGFLAVVVALLAKGWIYALIVLALVVAVQQLEGNVVQPLVMGRAVSVHPLGVLLGLTAGAVVAGIAGALLAVPVLAFVDHFVRALHHESQEAACASAGECSAAVPRY